MTLIDKAEAHDDDLIRRGDALKALCDEHGFSLVGYAAIAALPARGVGVKPLQWAHQVKMPSGNLEVRTQEDGRVEFFTHCGLYTIRDRGTPDAPMFMLRRLAAPLLGSAKLSELYEAAQKDHEACILAALDITNVQKMHIAALYPTDAAHVNKTPKSEHDAGNVLTAAQAREAALREAADSLLEASVWCDSQERTSPEWHNGVADARKHHIARILALIGEART